MYRHAPGLRIRFRIVNGDFHIHVTEVMAAETFDGVIGIAMGMPAVIEVRLIVETDRIHDEGVAIPLANRVTQPCGLRLSRKAAAIRENLPVTALVLEKNQRYRRRLDDLERCCRYQHGVRYSVRQATPGRPVFAEVLLPLLV